MMDDVVIQHPYVIRAKLLFATSVPQDLDRLHAIIENDDTSSVMTTRDLRRCLWRSRTRDHDHAFVAFS